MNDDQRMISRSWLGILVIATVLALVMKLVLALTTIGTNDVLRWETFLMHAQLYGGIGLYHRVGYFNHPPFMIHVLHVIAFMTSLTGLSFPFWLRLPAMLADIGSLILVWRILELYQQGIHRRAALLCMAVAPPSILISGFHGNTDPVMIFFVLLAIYLLERGHSVWLAGVAFGMSLNIKVAAIIFIPALVLYLPTLWKRGAYSAATGAVFTIGSLPYLLQDPVFILQRIFGYDSLYGHWGLSRLFTGLRDMELVVIFNTIYAAWGKFIVLGSIVAVAGWMNWSRKKPPLFFQCGVVAFVFMSLTPGFGVQYLAWLVPWVAGVGLWAALTYYTASGIFLSLVYTFWAQEFPWRLANADAPGVGDWSGSVIYAEVLCWVSVVVVLCSLLKGVLRYPVEDRRRPTPTPTHDML